MGTIDDCAFLVTLENPSRTINLPSGWFHVLTQLGRVSQVSHGIWNMQYSENKTSFPVNVKIVRKVDSSIVPREFEKEPIEYWSSIFDAKMKLIIFQWNNQICNEVDLNFNIFVQKVFWLSAVKYKVFINN